MNPTVDRCDINDLAKKMLSDESVILMEQKRGIKKFLEEINKLDIANKADIASYQLGISRWSERHKDRYGIHSRINKNLGRYLATCPFFMLS